MASPADNGGHFPDRAYLSLTGGTLTGALTGTSSPWSGVVLISSGTAVAPGLAFSAETQLGIYRKGTNQMGFGVAGAEYAYLDGANGFHFVTATAATGYDAQTATTLIVGASTATGVRVGKSGGAVGFYGTTPIAIGASVADASGGATIDAEARTAINALISRIEALGLITTV